MSDYIDFHTVRFANGAFYPCSCGAINSHDAVEASPAEAVKVELDRVVYAELYKDGFETANPLLRDRIVQAVMGMLKISNDATTLHTFTSTQLDQIRAEVWDEGWMAYHHFEYSDIWPGSSDKNPYRAAEIRKGNA